MQRILFFVFLFLVPTYGLAQDWDDFEPPPPADFGNIPPPPPPPPMNDFNPPPQDFRPPPSFSPGNVGDGGSYGGSGGKLSLGAVKFKKTGEKKDLNQMNPRIEELLQEDRKLNGD
ncbi:MAG: hypothetical protein A4S09_07065 [Proteobacteria bacterium SG_bin7]|nr:MAG: hypothetical protein A4S09_07065 [Proteobacteria bacterium SG_bin7]